MLITARRGSTLSSSQLRGAQRGAAASQHPSQRFTARSTLSAQYHGHALLSVTALYSITLCTASRHALHNTCREGAANSQRPQCHGMTHAAARGTTLSSVNGAGSTRMARSTGSARAARSAHAQYGVARARRHGRGTRSAAQRSAARAARRRARHDAQLRAVQAARAWHA